MVVFVFLFVGTMQLCKTIIYFHDSSVLHALCHALSSRASYPCLPKQRLAQAVTAPSHSKVITHTWPKCETLSAKPFSTNSRRQMMPMNY